MTNAQVDFDMWFDHLAAMVGDATGINFTDRDSVADDYDAGASTIVVAADIIAEYNA